MIRWFKDAIAFPLVLGGITLLVILGLMAASVLTVWIVMQDLVGARRKGTKL